MMDITKMQWRHQGQKSGGKMSLQLDDGTYGKRKPKSAFGLDSSYR